MVSESLEHKILNRKGFLKMSGMVGVATILSACSNSDTLEPNPISTSPIPAPSTSTPTSAPPTAPSTTTPLPKLTEVPAQTPVRNLAVRFAQISDMHIPEDGTGLKEFSLVFQNLLTIDPPVDFVINTGDSIMDALGASKATALAEWDAFQSVLPADFPVPIYHCLGNHDIWGWDLPDEEQARMQHDPGFGKALALQKLGLPNRYYKFELNGWSFIVLDSNHIAEYESDNPYTGKLDEEQYDWLVSELTSTPSTTPICIISHIPIFGACNLLDGSKVNGNWVLPGAWQHIDGDTLIALFWKHRNVVLCISGHTHMIEDLRFHGVKYLTNGSICGNWWNGPYHDFPPAYVVINLYEDGSSDCEVLDL